MLITVLPILIINKALVALFITLLVNAMKLTGDINMGNQTVHKKW